MQICLQCNSTLDHADWSCSHCEYKPDNIDGYLSFAPELLNSKNKFYDKKSYAKLYQLESQHFWFRTRNQIILYAIEKFFPNMKKFLEIGCGTGYVIGGIRQKFPHIKLYAADIFMEALPFVETRTGTNSTLFQMDARCIPYQSEFDLIGAFDVLEHIKEDTKVLYQIHKALKPTGGVILTVPQHPHLWSFTDTKACHVRRYTRNELQNKLKDCGFKLIFSTSFITLLYPFMLFSRLLQKDSSNGRNELECSKLTNFCLEKVLALESKLIKAGVKFPLGGSRLIVAQKI